jgi:hypothetical protein
MRTGIPPSTKCLPGCREAQLIQSHPDLASTDLLSPDFRLSERARKKERAPQGKHTLRDLNQDAGCVRDDVMGKVIQFMLLFWYVGMIAIQLG